MLNRSSPTLKPILQPILQTHQCYACLCGLKHFQCSTRRTLSHAPCQHCYSTTAPLLFVERNILATTRSTTLTLNSWQALYIGALTYNIRKQPNQQPSIGTRAKQGPIVAKQSATHDKQAHKASCLRSCRVPLGNEPALRNFTGRTEQYAIAVLSWAYAQTKAYGSSKATFLYCLPISTLRSWVLI